MNLKNNQDWLIGYPESNKLSSFSRLPTKKYVLGRYSHLHFYSKGNTSARDIFKLVLGELKEGNIDLGVSKFLECREDRLSIDFQRSSTKDQKWKAFEVSELVKSADEEDTEFTLLPLKKRNMPLTISLEISAKKLSEVTASVADRYCLSVCQQLLFQSTIICKSGGNLDEISVSTVHRQRQNARENIVLSIKADWEINKPKKAILHWDSKLFHLNSSYQWIF
nr:uncharacterized protein LOC124806791 [Hydra vulgaris]